ncbi:MAG TPA: SPOR domain-containing protein [Steroidobacteraceae bacterium]|nr:SPOR domain-containing protein [Steroidobacteraceae bacterium]
MDSRAKQRLTGAVILVAVFVLFVPELLTGPKQAAPTDMPTEEGLRRYTIDLDAQSNPAQPMAGPGAPAVALPPVADNPRQAAPALATPGEAAAPAPDTPASSHPSASPAEKNNVAAATPPTPAPRVETPRPAPAAVEKGSFAVQLGSFGSRDNADRLVRDMTAKGFAAFVAPITSNGRELYRVRVGPTRDRTQAEALAAQLRRIGQTGSIVPIS